MTRDEAISLYDSEFWLEMTHEEIAKFQLFEDRLCMPFGIFHEAVNRTLNRHVLTHEFSTNSDGLKKELLGEQEPPSFEDIINMIPESKRIIVKV